MALSKREISFYIYVTSFSIYVLTFLLFLYFPVRYWVLGTLSMDAIIGSSLLIPFAHGISVVCFVLANKIFAYFPVGKTIGIMTVAYPAVLLGVSFFL